MHALVVINQNGGSFASAGGALSGEDVATEFARHGVSADVRLVEPAAMASCFRAAVHGKYDAAFVGGGDGSVNLAAGILGGTALPLGVLPFGTLNHFAHDIRVPMDWKEAVAALATAQVRAVDVGEVNGRVFVNNCSLGAYPAAVMRRDALRGRGARKWWAMFVAVVLEFVKLRRIRFELQLADRITQLRTPFVLISNNRYSGHVLSQRMRPRLDEGTLCVYTTRAGRRFELLRLAWQSVTRRLDSADGLESYSVADAVIRTSFPRLPIGVDGEVVKEDIPLQLNVRPAHLRVLMPAAPSP